MSKLTERQTCHLQRGSSALRQSCASCDDPSAPTLAWHTLRTPQANCLEPGIWHVLSQLQSDSFLQKVWNEYSYYVNITNNPNLIVLTFTPVKHIQNMTLPSLPPKFYILWHTQSMQSLFPRNRCAHMHVQMCVRECALWFWKGEGSVFLKQTKP